MSSSARGAGLRLDSETEERVRAGSETMLNDPTYAAAAQRLAAELRSGLRIEEAVEVVAGAARERAA